MEVKLDKRYPIAASIDQAWAVLCDIRAVAACMPGAQITEQLDETHFKGTVKSKVGPAVMSFGGDIELQGLDAAARSLQMLGKGADKSGSSASMQLAAHLEAAGADAGPGACVLVGVATISVSGKLAQFGSRLLVPVSDAMLAQFADNFRAAAVAVPVVAAPVGPPDVAATNAASAASTSTAAMPVAPGAAAADLPQAEEREEAAAAAVAAVAAAPLAPTAAAQAASPMPVAAAAAAVPVSAPVSAPAPARPPAPMPAAAPAPAPRPVQPVKELNALALLWTVFKGWLAGLFGRK